MAINWNPPGRGPAAPSPVSTGLASIQDMLEAFHSRRQQREIAEMQEQRLRDQLAMEAGFKRVDDEREAHRIELENTRGLGTQALKKAELEQEQRRWAGTGLNDVMKDEELRKARDRGDFTETNARLSPFGAQWQRQEAPQLEAPPVPEAPRPTERDAAGLQNHLSDVMYGILPRNTAVPEAEATSPQALQQLPQRLEQGQQEHDRAQGYADRIGAMNQQTAAEYQKAPVYSLVGDIPGAGLTYRVGEGTRLRNEALRPIFDSLPANDPDEQEIKRYVQSALQNSADDPQKVSKQALDMYANLLRDRRAEKRAYIEASKQDDSKANDDRRLWSAQANDIWDKTVNQQEFKSQLDSHRTLLTLEQLLSSENPASHKIAAGLWDKWAAGPGAVQAGERSEFRKTIGGLWEKWKQDIKNAVGDGSLPEYQRQAMLKAIKSDFMPLSQANMGVVRGTVESRFSDAFDPEIRERAPSALKLFDAMASRPLKIASPQAEGLADPATRARRLQELRAKKAGVK